MPFLDRLPFPVLLWLVPIFLALHNIEEAPFMERWSKRLPVKIHPMVSTRQFVIAVTFLTIASFLVTYTSLHWLTPSIGYLLILEMQAILFFNAFIPHLATTVRFRLYSPGLVTAVFITIPFSIYLFQRAFVEGILTWRQFWLLLGIAPIAMVALAFVSLQLGKMFTKAKSTASIETAR